MDISHPAAPQHFHSPQGRNIAYHFNHNNKDTDRAGHPTVIFCGGFASDMEGSKAMFLHDLCHNNGIDFLRFDYSGHGQSSGDFEDGTIGDWYQDLVELILHLGLPGPLVMVGSSMGGWMSMLAARDMPHMVRDLVLIAPAPDFPSQLTWPRMDEAAKKAVLEDGKWVQPSEYDDTGLTFTKKLIDEATNHTLLDKDPVKVAGKVRILHGTKDDAVPLDHGLRVLEALDCADAQLIAVKGGDHRLSNEAALKLLDDVINEIAAV